MYQNSILTTNIDNTVLSYLWGFNVFVLKSNLPLLTVDKYINIMHGQRHYISHKAIITRYNYGSWDFIIKGLYFLVTSYGEPVNAMLHRK